MKSIKSIFNINILVMDSQPMICKNFETFFHDEPYTMHIVDSFEQLSEKLAQCSMDKYYDLIIVDANIENSTEKDFTVNLKKNFPFIKLIAHSIIASETMKVQYLNAGFDDIFPKPIKFIQIKEKILAWCEIILKEYEKEMPHPAKQKNEKAHESENRLTLRSAAISLPDIHVLVVDDSPFIQDAINFISIEAPYHIDIAGNGIEAIHKLNIAKDWQYDLILLDINMPFMNGIETINAIRTLYPGILIYAHTSEAGLRPRESFMADGFDDVIDKAIGMKLKELLYDICSMIVDKHNKIFNQSTKQILSESISVNANQNINSNEYVFKEQYDALFERYSRLEIRNQELIKKNKILEDQIRILLEKRSMNE